MSLYEKIKNIYPEISDEDFTLHDDGSGPYIKEWMYGQQKPTQEQLDAASDTCVALENAKAENNRRTAYIAESDPLFFKEQAGEVPVGTWAAARQAIKDRFPKVEE